MSIYFFNSESRISQGDIFKNIPFMSFNILMEETNEHDFFHNDTTKIIDNILTTGNDSIIKTVVDSTLCILSSQDCDVINQDILIFHPLEKIEPDVNELINIGPSHPIRIKTRTFYLPKLDINGFIGGPYRVNFENPISIPKNIIVNRLLDNRIASLTIEAKRIFVNKITQFFNRLPLDEIMFLNQEEIDRYLLKCLKDSKNQAEFKLKIAEVESVMKKYSRLQEFENLVLIGDVSKKFRSEIELFQKNIEFLSFFISKRKFSSHVRLIKNIRNTKDDYSCLVKFIDMKKTIISDLYKEEIRKKFEENIIMQTNSTSMKDSDFIKKKKAFGSFIQNI